MNRSLRWMCATLAAGVLFGLVSEASAQVRVDVPGARVNVRATGSNYQLYGRRPWFANDGVRRQLKLDDNQYSTLNKTYAEYWTPYNQAVTTVPADLEAAERQRRIQTAYGTFYKNYYDNTSKAFVDADTRNRYNQLNLQYQGYAAFNDPQVQTRLKLTDEQRKNFNQYYNDWNKQMNTYASEYAKDRDSVNKQFGDSWKQSRTRINETLTPEQRKAWNEMTGESYDFPADTYFDDGEAARDGGAAAPGSSPRGNQPRNPGTPAPGTPAPGTPAPAPSNPR